MSVKGAIFRNNVRTFLTRIWDESKPIITIVMYYPSMADEVHDDTTIKRCIGIAKYNNYGGIHVYNIHDSVYTDIPSNDILVAWGTKLSISQSKCLIDSLRIRYRLLCFTKTKHGLPGQPTRLSMQTNIIPF